MPLTMHERRLLGRATFRLRHNRQTSRRCVHSSSNTYEQSTSSRQQAAAAQSVDSSATKHTSPAHPQHHVTPSLTSTAAIRTSFLQYFTEQTPHKHLHQPAASLIPDSDPSLLFINAGMAPLKDYFLDLQTPPAPQLTSIQPCVRAGGKHNDLSNVGYTTRHHTLFEMLGNFSFGSYGKEETIVYAWQYLTEVLRIPAQKLHVTVHHSDTEAARIWSTVIGCAVDDTQRIRRLGDADNHWSMGETGPCGSCSEVFYQLDTPINGETELEIWNLVFMSHERLADGQLIPLQRACVDTGMGLERVANVMQGVSSNYDTDGFQHIIEAVRQLHAAHTHDSNATLFKRPIDRRAHAFTSNPSHGYSVGLDNDASAVAIKVIADHIRTITFLLAEGVIPSNVGRGYVLRRINRRAITYGAKIGFMSPFLHQLVAPVVTLMSPTYTHLAERQPAVTNLLAAEEQLFFNTLQRGISVLNDKLATSSSRVLSGDDAFLLYDSHGFPVDLTQILAADAGFSVDETGFDRKMMHQRELARAAWSGSDKSLKVPAAVKQWQQQNITNAFTGYETTIEPNAQVVAVSVDDVSQLTWVAINPNPFYATSGGQQGDSGKLTMAHGSDLDVLTCIKAYDGLTVLCIDASAHADGENDAVSTLRVGSTVKAAVDPTARRDTAAHHTATHLLHSALRALLTDNNQTVQQAGSYVGPDKLRFDFTASKALTPAQLIAIEEWVNRAILTDAVVNIEVMTLEAAKQLGAIALFGEKYNASAVRVVDVPDISTELCGGTHTKSLRPLYPFKILGQSSVAAGTRRIEAGTGVQAVHQLTASHASLQQIAATLRCKPDEVQHRVEKLSTQLDELKQQAARSQLSTGGQPTAQSAATVTHSVYHTIPVRIHQLTGDTIDNSTLRSVSEEAVKQLPTVIHVLLHPATGAIAVSTNPKAASSNAHDVWKYLQTRLSKCMMKGGGNTKLALGRIERKDSTANVSQLIADALEQTAHKL